REGGGGGGQRARRRDRAGPGRRGGPGLGPRRPLAVVPERPVGDHGIPGRARRRIDGARQPLAHGERAMIRTRHPVVAATAGLTALTVALAAVAIVRAGAGRASSPTAPGSTAAIQLFAAHGEASLVPALAGERPLFILALGSDARPGQNALRERSDSIHLIGVNLRTHQATILGFP